MLEIRTWQDYCQSTNLTATYPDAGTGSALELAYLTLGLVGELEEALQLSHTSSIGETLSAGAGLLAELGDCYWYLARLDLVYGLPNQNVSLGWNGVMNGLKIARYNAGRMANAAKKCLRDNASPAATAEFAGLAKAALDSFSEQLTRLRANGSAEEQLVQVILQPNLQKLLSRKDRGTIGGDGDYR